MHTLDPASAPSGPRGPAGPAQADSPGSGGWGVCVHEKAGLARRHLAALPGCLLRFCAARVTLGGCWGCSASTAPAPRVAGPGSRAQPVASGVRAAWEETTAGPAARTREGRSGACARPLGPARLCAGRSQRASGGPRAGPLSQAAAGQCLSRGTSGVTCTRSHVCQSRVPAVPEGFRDRGAGRGQAGRVITLPTYGSGSRQLLAGPRIQESTAST